MADPRDDGAPANPVTEIDQSTGRIHFQHMGATLWDAFAMAALPAVIEQMGKAQGIGSPTFWNNVAIHTARAANAMLAEREGRS